MISAIMALMALAIDLLLPAFDDIKAEFGLDPDSNTVAQVITAFFMGLAVAQIVWGPLADRFGRKPVLYGGLTIYALGAIGSALAPSFGWLLAARFLWGVGAAASRVVAMAIIRDSFEGTRMARAMSLTMAVFVMAPVFAPALGAGLMAVFSYRALFWFCLIWAGVIALWSLRLTETLRPEHRRPLDPSSTAQGFRAVVAHPITTGYTGATMFLQAVFAAYLGSSERIIDEVFNRGDQFPLIFGAVALLFAVSAVINGVVVGRFGIQRLVHVTLAAVVTLAVALVVISVTASGQPSFWLFMPTFGVLVGLFMFLMPNLNTAALDPMGEVAGTAASLTGAARVAGGAVLGAIVDTQVRDSTTPFAVAVLVFLAGAALSVWWAERLHNAPKAPAPADT